MSTLGHASLGLGQTPALLVIDATLGFTDPASPLACPADAALQHIEQLLTAARARGWPIAFSSNAYATPDEASVFRAKLPVLNELQAGGRWAEIHPRLTPREGELLLRKTVPSAFFDTPLRAWLAKRRVDSALLCGFSTSGCVRASAVDALQCNLRVVVAGDACADRDALAHDYNLRDLGLKTGDVLPTATLLTWMNSP
ncbi:isochorismatase family protein [Inhella sp.]|uniref:isochorismatase family protein n=1 Tax=Inhella sp. TaxID=1921806 RepID=UPI0035B17751